MTSQLTAKIQFQRKMGNFDRLLPPLNNDPVDMFGESLYRKPFLFPLCRIPDRWSEKTFHLLENPAGLIPVSYTHLTLPTILLV